MQRALFGDTGPVRTRIAPTKEAVVRYSPPLLLLPLRLRIPRPQFSDVTGNAKTEKRKTGAVGMEMLKTKTMGAAAAAAVAMAGCQ